MHLFHAASLTCLSLAFGSQYMAPLKHTSWVFHIGAAEAPGEIYAPPAPLTRLPAPAVCHPSPGLLLPSLEVLTQEGGLLMAAMGVQWGGEARRMYTVTS